MMSALPPRRRDISPDELRPFIVDQRAGDTHVIPNRDAFAGASALGRADGLFVMQIRVLQDGSFEQDDLDELAYLVSMVAKSALGHVHYHHHLPGMGKRKRLKPTSVLMLAPVPLAPAGWDETFAKDALTSAQLRDAITLADKAPEGETPRLAASCLRRNYLNLERVVNFQIVNSRQLQARVGPMSLAGLPNLVGLSLIATFLLSMILTNTLPLSFAAAARIGGEMLNLPMAAAGISFGIALSFAGTLFRWHRPVLKLLRTAHGFYTAAQTLNPIIARLGLAGACAEAGQCDFQAIIASYESKIAGEENRQTQLVTWLSLMLAIASLFVAIYAITDARRQGPDETLPVSLSEASLDRLAQVLTSSRAGPTVRRPTSTGVQGAVGSGAASEATPVVPNRRPDA